MYDLASSLTQGLLHQDNIQQAGEGEKRVRSLKLLCLYG